MYFEVQLYFEADNRIYVYTENFDVQLYVKNNNKKLYVTKFSSGCRLRYDKRSLQL